MPSRAARAGPRRPQEDHQRYHISISVNRAARARALVLIAASSPVRVHLGTRSKVRRSTGAPSRAAPRSCRATPRSTAPPGRPRRSRASPALDQHRVRRGLLAQDGSRAARALRLDGPLGSAPAAVSPAASSAPESAHRRGTVVAASSSEAGRARRRSPGRRPPARAWCPRPRRGVPGRGRRIPACCPRPSCDVEYSPVRPARRVLRRRCGARQSGRAASLAADSSCGRAHQVCGAARRRHLYSDSAAALRAIRSTRPVSVGGALAACTSPPCAASARSPSGTYALAQHEMNAVRRPPALAHPAGSGFPAAAPLTPCHSARRCWPARRARPRPVVPLSSALAGRPMPSRRARSGTASCQHANSAVAAALDRREAARAPSPLLVLGIQRGCRLPRYGPTPARPSALPRVIAARLSEPPSQTANRQTSAGRPAPKSAGSAPPARPSRAPGPSSPGVRPRRRAARPARRPGAARGHSRQRHEGSTTSGPEAPARAAAARSLRFRRPRPRRGRHASGNQRTSCRGIGVGRLPKRPHRQGRSNPLPLYSHGHAHLAPTRLV